MSRYLQNNSFPQPIRKVLPASSDIIHVLKMGERLDNIANKWYGDPLKAWVIMCANPQWDNEFEINPGDTIRIPYPLSRVFNAWKIENEI